MNNIHKNKAVEWKAYVTDFLDLSLKKCISLQKGLRCYVTIFFLLSEAQLSSDPSAARVVGCDGHPNTLQYRTPCIPQHPAYHGAR